MKQRPNRIGRVIALVLPLAVLSAGIMTMGADPIGGLAMLRSGSNAIVADIFENFGIGGSIDVRKLGVVADGTDRSTQMQEAIDATVLGFPRYSHFVFRASAQPYMIQNVTISRPIHIEIQPGATVQRYAAATGLSPMFQLIDGSDGTVMDGGGTCDGNRDAIGSQFVAGDQWPCFKADHTSAKIDLRLLNFVGRAAMFGNCDAGMDVKLIIEDSGTAVNSYNCQGRFHLTERRIGNNGVVQFAHPNTFFGTKNTDLFLSLDDWNPDALNLDPIPVGAAFHEDGGGNSYVVRVSGFHGTDTNGEPACRGVVLNGGTNSTYDFTSIGCVQGIRINGMTDSHLKCYADGSYIVANGYENMPWRIGYGAWQQTNITNSTWDTNGMSPSARNIIDCTGIRGKFNYLSGIQDSFVRAVAQGNTSFGIKVGCEITSTPFMGQPGQCPERLILDAQSSYNGDSGIGLAGFRDVTIRGSLLNNGQAVPGSLGGVWRAGVTFNATVLSLPTDLFIAPDTLVARDTQTFICSDCASFEPGTSDSNNQYKITLVNPQRANSIGQYITLNDAGGTGTSITGKIVAVSNDFQQRTMGGILSYGWPTDVITLETAAPVTYGSSGNLTALTGTASGSGLTITITGGAASAELPGHIWITDGTEWRRVEAVRSDTNIAINQPFTTPLSGASLSKLSVDITGIPSQAYGVSLADTGLTGLFRFAGIDAKGSINGTVYFNGQANLLEFDNAFQMRGVSGATNLTSGATLYVGPGVASADQNQVGQILHKAGLVKTFTCGAQTPPPVGNSITCTLGQGGNDTPSTCTMNAGENSCSITTVNPPFAENYKVYAKFVASASITSTPVYWAAALVPGFTQ